jgi:hypothetical protein
MALAIVGALLAIAFGGLRVALAAWRQGEDYAESHQHVRGVALALANALGGTYPYRGSRGLSPDPVLLFKGTEHRLEAVTQTPPFPFAIPIAFTAVVLSLEEGEKPGLVVRQRPLPNQEPFSEGAVVLQDPSVTTLVFAYMDEGGTWRDAWDGEEEQAMPRAVRLTLGVTLNGRAQTLPPITVSLRTSPP